MENKKTDEDEIVVCWSCGNLTDLYISGIVYPMEKDGKKKWTRAHICSECWESAERINPEDLTD